MNYPKVVEEKDKIIVIYSEDPVHNWEEDDGIILFFSKEGEIVKIVIPKDEDYHLLFL